MELNQDWRKLRTTFYPSSIQPKGLPSTSISGTSTIYCVHDRGVVTMLFSPGEDLAEWVGASLEEIRSQFSSRVVLEFDQKSLDSAILTSLSEPHLEAQIKQWRDDSRASAGITENGVFRSVGANRKDLDFFERHLVAKKHFLLDVLTDSWWSQVLPSSFGVFLRLDGAKEASFLKPSRDFLLVYRKGKLEQFGVPDLSFLGADRRKDVNEVVKYIADRCMLPVQGALIREEDWIQWSSEANPWREIAWAVQSSRIQLAPFRWSVVSLLAGRGLIGI